MIIRKNATAFWTHNRFDPATGCWNWTGSKHRQGYGWKTYLGRVELVHRLSAHFYLGFDLRSTLLVCHRCDNPSCFNPAHLFIGTDADNAKDCVAKGRLNNHGARMTHCSKGHLFGGDNLHILPDGKRRCRECNRQSAARQRAKL